MAVSDGITKEPTMSEQITIPKRILEAEVDTAVKRHVNEKPLPMPYIADYEAPEYSLGRAIRCQISGRLDGYEAETH